MAKKIKKMKKMKKMKKWEPSDAANTFVRVILSDAGVLLGGFDEEDWGRTMDYFGGRCAYSGAVLRDGDVDRDHAVPINKDHCGVHLYGNVLPTTRAKNRAKKNRHYRDVIDDPELLERVETFVADSGYTERVAAFGDLRPYCKSQYKAIVQLCQVNRSYLESLLPAEAGGEARRNPVDPVHGPSPGPLPLARDRYCFWLSHVVEQLPDGRTVGLSIPEVVRRVRESHPNASEAAARSHVTYIRQGTRGCDGYRLPDLRR